MKNIFKLLLLLILVFATTSFTYLSVRADGDDEKREHNEYKYRDDGYKHKEDDEKREHNEHKYGDDGDKHKEDDDVQYEERIQNQKNKQINQTNEVMESWSKWSRSAAIGVSQEQLPIKDSMKVKIQNGNESITVVAYPYRSEVMIPIKETSELLGADVAIYENIQAVEVVYQQKQLICRLGSRAVYENGLKTPMPVPTLAYNNELYAPISVLANGLGYTITYDSQKGFIFALN
ncbi:copper amine oxidase N-terminal domain-containing protein [Bacillus massiliigorillae]|uniref:copper amine oxidase N-terminal domain-containing protein n=1 Tax=Bacillus massiliigorillae TaxID=1243664 RepID=UPI0003A57203|nr:copper amine oxidase N-terminal domain-containing protein [Bacillus massiliigorillae]